MDGKKNGNIHAGHRARIREKINNGAIQNMYEHEILEYLLFHTVPYKDTNLLAHKLINSFGSFHGVFDATYDDLMLVDGVSSLTATFLSSLPEIFKRYNEDCMKTTKINSIADVAKLTKMKFAGCKKEKMYMLCLDGNMNVINVSLIGDGDSHGVMVDKKSILETAIRSSCEYCIVIHNHPNGVQTPSSDDIEAVCIIERTLNDIEVKLFDSIIVAGNVWVSIINDKKYKEDD